MIGWFLGGFGPVGAVLVTLVAAFVGKGLGVIRIARLLQVPVRDVLPWAALARITARAAAAAVPAWLVARLLESMPPVALLTGGAVYAITYLVLCYAPGDRGASRDSPADRGATAAACPLVHRGGLRQWGGPCQAPPVGEN